MKKRNIIIILAIILLIVLLIVIGNLNRNETEKDDKVRIVTSFYPMYIMTLNITEEVENVEVENMADNQVGCIHDYTLTTSDLKKFENADIFVENGYGIENFSNNIKESYPNVKIIESASKITDTIEEHEEINAHFWTSIDNYILQVREIADRLKELDNANEAKYEENASEYITKLENLKTKYKNELQNLNGKKVVSLNEAFSYLFKFVGIEEELISTDHEQSALSAEQVKNVIDIMNNENIKTIIIAENDDEQNATAIANETGAKIYRLKDGMSGDGSINSYIDIMEDNLETLTSIE